MANSFHSFPFSIALCERLQTTFFVRWAFFWICWKRHDLIYLLSYYWPIFRVISKDESVSVLEFIISLIKVYTQIWLFYLYCSQWFQFIYGTLLITYYSFNVLIYGFTVSFSLTFMCLFFNLIWKGDWVNFSFFWRQLFIFV